MAEVGHEELCFICGKPGCEDRDHVIPSCFFADSKPDNLLTLPAHHRCHDAMDEEYTRNILATLHADKNETARELYEGKISRSMKRSAPLRAAILSTLRPEVDVKSHGGIIVGKAPGIQFDRERVYPVLEKIVKGLWLYHRGAVMPVGLSMGWHIFHVPPQGAVLEVFKHSKPGLSFPPVFRSKYLIFPREGEDNEVCVWWLQFYGDLAMYCVVDGREKTATSN
jgi:hypothetical protein